MRGTGSGFRLALALLRGQAALAALLLALALLLPVGAGALLEAALRGEGGFSGLTVALADEGEGDGTTRRLTAALAALSGTEGYCRWLELEPEAARAALEAGEVTAVLLLPEGFLQSVLTGENLPVTLLVDRARPLESWLVQWLGQSVSRMLAAAQAGIYTVSGQYRAAGLTEPAQEEMLLEINLVYLGWVSGRGEIYDTVTVSATGALAVADHYALSAAAYLPLLTAPLLYPAFGGVGVLAWHRRRRAAGLPPETGALGAVAAAALVLLPLIWLPLGVLSGGAGLPAGLGPAALTAWAAAAYGALCALLARSPGAAGLSAFLPATLALVLSGGVLPQALLPRGLRALSGLCPLTWAREALSAALGYEVRPAVWLALAALAALETAAAALLFRVRVDRREEGEG